MKRDDGGDDREGRRGREEERMTTAAIGAGPGDMLGGLAVEGK